VYTPWFSPSGGDFETRWIPVEEKKQYALVIMKLFPLLA